MRYLCLLGWCFLAAVSAQSSSLSSPASFPLESLAPGQAGYAVTAGAGNVLERFPIEVLGVQYDNADFPLVLIKASGDFIERTGGIAAGMSGSPVYLPMGNQDALLGAICCTFANSEPGLALVTPIEVMRRADPNMVQLADVPAWGRQMPLEQAVPVATPVLFSGLSERASGLLEPLFSNASVTPFPVQNMGFGVTDSADANFQLQPGSSISVQLVRGDITVAALGTVTAIDGDNIYAFGHPLLGDGEVSFAFAPAHVSYIVPNDVVSFKLANSGRRVLGTITQDRPYAISGKVGSLPRYLPVTLTLSEGLADEEVGNRVNKRFELASGERYYPALLATATLEVFDEVLAKTTPGNAELIWDITLNDGTTLQVTEQITSRRDIASATARLTGAPLAILANNIFAAPQVARVAVDIRYSTNQRYADIVQVVSERDEIRAGDTITAYVRLQPYRAEPEVKTLRIPIPEGVDEDELQLIFRGGLEPPTRPSTGRQRQENDDDDEEEQDFFTDKILTFEELLIALRQNVQASELIVETVIDGDVERLLRLSLPYLVSGVETVFIDIQPLEGDDTADTP